MTRTKNKKEVEENPIINNEVEEKVEKKKKGEYVVYIEINDVVTEVKTDDIRGAIISAKPEFAKTALTVRVTKGNKTLDRFIPLQRAKRMFWDKIQMDAFIKNLIF